LSEIVIKKAETRQDFVKAIELVVELAIFEHLDPPDDQAQRRFVQDGFDRCPPRFEVWLSEIDGEVTGYILIVETYSTFLCKPTLYLEDLFVLPAYRRQGIGIQFLKHCVDLARSRGCGRMEWTCLGWNTRAQAVYEELGAVNMSEWLLYRLSGAALDG
jgi:GNAT superfamily N-acetyltransferase